MSLLVDSKTGVQSTSNRSKTASAQKSVVLRWGKSGESCECLLLLTTTDAHIHFQCIIRSALADDVEKVLEKCRKRMKQCTWFVFCHSESLLCTLASLTWCRQEEMTTMHHSLSHQTGGCFLLLLLWLLLLLYKLVRCPVLTSVCTQDGSTVY